MSSRRSAALAAVAFLAAVLCAQISPREVSRRMVLLGLHAPQEPALRRLSGTAAAFDRNFFIFLEGARRRLPDTAAGVAIVGVPATDQVFYLASYQLAPRPVLIAPATLPPGWIAAVYGRDRPAGFRVLADLPGGALLERAP